MHHAMRVTFSETRCKEYPDRASQNGIEMKGDE